MSVFVKRLISFRKHIVQAILTLFAASTVTFALLPLSPGSPAVSLLQNELNRIPTPAEIKAKEHELGLDRPLIIQYGSWLIRIIHGDLGVSWKTGQKVSVLVSERLGSTLLLGGFGFAVGLSASMLLALLATRFHNRLPDHVIRLITLLLAGIPTFVLGLLALQYIVIGLGIAQVISDGTLHTVLLPAVVMGLSGVNGRPLRAMLLEEMGSGYVRTMTARGASPTHVLWNHAFPNAMVPYLGMLGLSIGGLVGGDAIIESVFSWPGLGAYAIQAVQQRDVPVIQAFVLLSTLAFVIGSLLTDLIADMLDPRRQGYNQDFME